jgi:hypothetical protein
MRGIQSRASVRVEARQVSEDAQDRFHVVAVYGAFAVIAAIVFGTLPFHPF